MSYLPVLFRINQYHATKFNQRTAKSQLVAELGVVQPQLVNLFLDYGYLGTALNVLKKRTFKLWEGCIPFPPQLSGNQEP